MVAGKNRLALVNFPSCEKHPYILHHYNVRVIWCLVLTVLYIILPHAMGDKGESLIRDSFTSEIKSRNIVINPVLKIEGKEEAKTFLRHYGYMNCTDDESRQKRQLLDPEQVEEGGNEEEDEDPCDEEYHEALKMYQKQYKLNVTGVLDEETKKEMMKSRCGDPDKPGSNDDTENDEVIAPSNNNGHRKRRHTVTEDHSTLSKIRRWVNYWVGFYDGDELNDLRLVGREDVPDTVHWHLIPEGEIDSNKTKHTSLLQLILNPHKNKRRKRSRREEMLSEIKENIVRNSRTRRHTRNVIEPLTDEQGSRKRKRLRQKRDTKSRQKRDQSYSQNFNLTEGKVNHRWTNKKFLKYRIAEKGFSAKIPLIDQCSTVALAFRMWAEVTNLDFRPLHPSRPVSEVDILFGFGTGKHWDCDVPFDGPGGMIGHSMININDQGYISFHMDDGEPFKAYPKSPEDGIPLLYTVIHEIGHVLGLPHMFTPGSVMYPTLAEEIYEMDFELTPRDRKAVQQLYGKCTGRFDAMFDWLHTNPIIEKGYGCMTPCTCDSQHWQYYSYIFREDMYWLYLNSEKRPRYGDPLSISIKWQDLPDKIDAVVQLTRELKGICNGNTQFQLTTMFFSDEKYYIYDDIEDKVRSHNLISERFGPLPGQTTSVPSNLDAVMFDPRDNYLYFFKDQWVGVVDPFIDNPENGSCCLRQYNFSDYFQFNASEYQDWNITEEVPEITGYVDTVYLRYTERALYFFKNEYVYKADIGPVRRNKVWGDPGPVKLHFMGKWNTMWYDLCDVHTTILDYCSVSNLYIRH